ncbi:MAG TPA: MFS transporter [Lachnospiraceae bacterium]|nr:MFS transporter [Lachnospiraceae bacterium]
MRRSDREIKDFDSIVAVMKKCDVCHVALNNDGYPYILPLNFGLAMADGRIELYFHGAMEGLKYELIERDNRVGFEMDCAHRLVTEQKGESCSCTMEYESAIGRGHIEMLSDEEKQDALQNLMKHYHESFLPFNEAVAAKTKVFKLVVESVTGKARKKK